MLNKLKKKIYINIMNIIIDNRERDLIKICNENNEKIILKNLDLGDIVYEKDNEIIYIIERKTFNDLGASIKDGRYKEQKINLLENNNNNIYYIIEGDIKNCDTLNKKALLGSIINMIFRDNIKIIYSININQTYDIIKQIREKYNIGKFKKNEKKTNYVSCVKINKKENMDKKTCNIIQLASIPGVSKNIASIIIEKYDTINNLIEELKKNDQYLLEKLKIGKRSIGKVLSKKIYDYLI